VTRAVHVVGVGMIAFTQVGAGEACDVMGAQAARRALDDAGLRYALVEQAYVGHVLGESGAGQAAVYGLGLKGIPIINVDDPCASGSTALLLARQAVASGLVDCVLALGFDQRLPGPLAGHATDRASPLSRPLDSLAATQGLDRAAPEGVQRFGVAARAYMAEFGALASTFARIAVKARQHAARNPFALLRQPVTLAQVMASPLVFDPLTQLQCCPSTCGAAAAVLCSAAFARRHGLDARVRIAAQAMTGDGPSSFDPHERRQSVGADLARAAAAQVYAAAGVGPEDIDLVELHDCCTASELISYEALGLTPEGTAERFILDGDNTYGGRVVTNPSGGLLAKGHPPGATGLAQCVELTWQLRGQAEQRQVEGARLALQHNLGLGGACTVTLYEKVDA
jgi:acetyl-CoA acetyltransferase